MLAHAVLAAFGGGDWPVLNWPVLNWPVLHWRVLMVAGGAAILAAACAWRGRHAHGRARRGLAAMALVLAAAACVLVAGFAGHTQAASPTQKAGAAQHGQDSAEIDRMIGALRNRLAAAPGDAGNWVLLGRTLGAEARWAEAQDAFSHAVALRPDDAELHAQMGEVMTLQAHGTVTKAALAEFAHAPDDPRSRFYGALALAQDGHVPQAIDQLHALAADAPADAEWRQLVLDELQVLGGTQPPEPPPALADQLQDELSKLSARPPETQNPPVRTEPEPVPNK
jgi:cytochrome c-type biogenesis protein CcmH